MESALYDPESGFYNKRILKQDFYTAPELHPAFAGVLAREIAKRLDSLKAAGVPGPYSVVEMGAGSGLLARQILSAFRREHASLAATVRYVLVERSKGLLLESVSSLSKDFDRVAGVNELSELGPVAGVFLSNELVDAFPVHVLEMRDGKVQELYVEPSRKTALGPLSHPLLKDAAARVEFVDGQRHSVNLAALDWVKDVACRLKAGYLITIDYGSRYPATAPNPPRAFFRHHVQHDDGVLEEGRDITSNVDFETVIAEGAKKGLKLESYGTLSRFLIEGGIADWMPQGFDVAAVSERNKVKTLIHPEGMGETFKVLIQGKLPC
jgi:SAM-dependent MidA family methyltransferase